MAQADEEEQRHGTGRKEGRGKEGRGKEGRGEEGRGEAGRGEKGRDEAGRGEEAHREAHDAASLTASDEWSGTRDSRNQAIPIGIMDTVPSADARFPIGKFEMPATPLGDAQRAQSISDLADAPAALRRAVQGLSDRQLDTPYRDGGWTVRQLVHHLPDSHMNAYVRFKLALTEEEPAIKTYDEAKWAELDEARTGPIEMSLALLDALHVRWVVMLQSLAPDDLSRVFRHPQWGAISLGRTLALYAWHGRHHVAHVTALRSRMTW